MKYEDIELLEIPPEKFVKLYPLWAYNLIHIASPIDINIPSSKENLSHMINSVRPQSEKIEVHSTNKVHYLPDSYYQIPYVSLQYSAVNSEHDLTTIFSEIVKYKLLIWSPNKIKKGYLDGKPQWLRLPSIYKSVNYNNIEITKIKI